MKKTVISVSLPVALLKKLEQEAKKEKVSRSEIIKRSLSRHFFAHDVAKARNRAISELGGRGIVLTDADVFKVTN
jgi:metal-responsive CopG/Arc/MetJ family transcriptional regulator